MRLRLQWERACPATSPTAGWPFMSHGMYMFIHDHIDNYIYTVVLVSVCYVGDGLNNMAVLAYQYVSLSEQS